jgi:unsaturated chondroitin disaccharide hydrolase
MNFQAKKNILYLPLLFICIYACSDKQESVPDFSVANTGPYILNVTHLEMVKSNLDDPFFQQELNRLTEGADMLVARNDYQFVTDKTQLPPSGDIHDYMSIARYLWPDATGAYTINRDGITNPEIYNYDRPRLADISSAIYTLSLAWYFSNNEEYARKASELIHGWFLDETTRMNPNMNHAQVAKGVNNGELQGIIDANDFIQIIEAVSLIYDSNHWTQSSHIKLKEWFYHFSRWYVRRYNADAFCSDSGWCNNLSTWMDVQRASFFLFSEQEHLINSASHIMPVQTKISKQISFDGSQQFESQRKLSQHYVYFNLRGFMNLALIRKNRTGYDRDWPYLEGSDYGGLKPALDIIANFLSGADVAGFFVVNPDFNKCRYLEILRPATTLFNSEFYDQAARILIEQGCSDPDITLAYPPLGMLQEQPGIN